MIGPFGYGPRVDRPGCSWIAGGGRIVLRIRQPDGASALIVIDAATGRRQGLVRLKDGAQLPR